MADLKDEIVTQLAGLSREQLVTLLTELLAEAPELNDWFAAADGASEPAVMRQVYAAPL